MNLAKTAVAPTPMVPDFVLSVKRRGVGINAKFDFSWVNAGGFTRNELVACLRGAADHFEGIDRDQAARLWGQTIPFRARRIGS